MPGHGPALLFPGKSKPHREEGESRERIPPPRRPVGGALPQNEHSDCPLPVLHRRGGGGDAADERQPHLALFRRQRAAGGGKQPPGAGPGQFEPGQLPPADDAHFRHGVLPEHQEHGPGGGRPHRGFELAV